MNKFKISVKKSDASEVDQKDITEGSKNPLTSSKILSPLMPPKRGGSSTSLSKLSSAVMIPGLNRQLSRSTDDLNLSPPSASSNNPAEFISESLNVIAHGAEEDAAIVAQVAKENVLSPLAKLTKGIQNIGASLKKGGEEIGNAEVEIA